MCPDADHLDEEFVRLLEPLAGPPAWIRQPPTGAFLEIQRRWPALPVSARARVLSCLPGWAGEVMDCHGVVALAAEIGEPEAHETVTVLFSRLCGENMAPFGYSVHYFLAFPRLYPQLVSVLMPVYRMRNVPGDGLMGVVRALAGALATQPESERDAFLDIFLGRSPTTYEEDTVSVQAWPYRNPAFARWMVEKIRRKATLGITACMYLPEALLSGVLEDCLQGRVWADWPELLPVLEERGTRLSAAQVRGLCAHAEPGVRLAAIRAAGRLSPEAVSAVAGRQARRG